jgi:hypothetical protein
LQLGRFSKLIVNGMAEDKERGFIRETKNYQDDHGASDVSSGRAGGSAATTTLAADGLLPSSLIRVLTIPALFKFTWPRHPKESQLIFLGSFRPSLVQGCLPGRQYFSKRGQMANIL